MPDLKKTNPEVQPKPTRRTFSAKYKQRIVAKADQCAHGKIGALLRREGLYHSQIAAWRKAAASGTLGTKKRGPVADPDRAEKRRLERENELLRRKLADAEAIIDAKKVSRSAGSAERGGGEMTATAEILAEQVGVSRACGLLDVPRSTPYRARQPRPEPKPAGTEISVNLRCRPSFTVCVRLYLVQTLWSDLCY